MGEVKLFLGVDITKYANHFVLSQKHTIEELAKKYRMENEKPTNKLPPLHTIDLNEKKHEANPEFRSLVGSLAYIGNLTRPDICSEVSLLARYFGKPNRLVWKYAKQVLSYLVITKEKGLHLRMIDNSDLQGFADSNFSLSGDRKS